MNALCATHYVDPASTSPVPPYTNWTTAATDIQNAVDAAQAGDTVMVTNGHYLLSAEIAITSGITIQSVNGPEVTIVDGQGSVRCFHLDNHPCLLSGLTITKGYTESYQGGGGIYCSGRTPVITNCMIIGNGAAYSGGGIRGGSVNNSTISDNFSRSIGSSHGGGGVAYGTANNCVISHNYSKAAGGGILGGTANNCVISGNIAEDNGGGITTSYTCDTFGFCYPNLDAVANHCTIIGNSANRWGGLVLTRATNSIVWHNESGNIGDISLVQYSCSPDLEHGVNGNITNAPMLITASHVASNSPCRGAGSFDASIGTDIDGELWQDPPSMGCDEYHGAVTGALQVAMLPAPDLFPAASHMFWEIIRGAPTLVIWDFGDGSTATNEVFVEHAWDLPGVYPVILTAYNDTFPNGVSATQSIHVAGLYDAAIHVAVDGDDSHDGTSWMTAKATIQAGVDAQTYYGGLVWVSNGVYALTSEITVEQPVIVQGVNGADVTTVDGQGSVRCFNLDNISCTLSGLTITNGYTGGEGGGIYCTGTNPMVTNCVISGNHAYSGGGMNYGRAVHCMFYGNYAQYQGGAMYRGTAVNCSITSNSVYTFGGGLRSVTAINCTITGSTAHFGGGMHFGTAINCTITGNSAVEGGGLRYTQTKNCIVWNNAAPTDDNYYGAAENVSFSCLPDVQHGVAGNITNAPLFVDRLNGNYRLQSGSPCINAGNNMLVEYGADREDHPRIVAGIVDMGAYESGFEGYSITNMVSTGHQTLLEWSAFPMWESTIYWSACLTNEFQPLEAGIDYPLNSYTDLVHAVESQGFYKVNLRLK